MPTVFAAILHGSLWLIVSVLATGRTAWSDDAVPLVPTVDVFTASIVDRYDVEDMFSGLVTARQSSALGFQTGGLIQSVSADVGDRVRAGELLATLDTRALRAQLAAVEAGVGEARANHAFAQATVGRQRTLQEQGHVSSQAVDEAQAQAEGTRARIEAAVAQAETLQVEIDLARLVAPFAGKITNRLVDEGEISVSGATILELMEIDHLEASIGVPADVAASLVPGERYSLKTDAGLLDATFKSSADVLGTGQRTVPVVFDLTGAQDIPVGTFATLSVARQLSAQGTWIPRAALREATRGLWTALVAVPTAEGGHIAQQRLVEVIHDSGDRVFVRGGIEQGDQVIIGANPSAVLGRKLAIRQGEDARD